MTRQNFANFPVSYFSYFRLRLNLAMCYLKQNKWIEARNLCDKVLEENPNVAKAYFRRGESLYNLNDHELGKIS